jgi:hypothetical protein
MAKEKINRAGIYSSYLRNAMASGVFFLCWFCFVFVLVFIFKTPLNEPFQFCSTYQEFSFGHRSILQNTLKFRYIQR